jgi:CopG family nickel-responsive transcriptional regulator
MDQDLMKIGISLPENLLNRFDEIILHRGYSSRSEAARDAIGSYIIDYEWMSDVGGERMGVITIVYDHSQSGPEDNLTRIQHDFGAIIQSCLHVHLNHDICLEVVALKGEGQGVRAAAEKMMALKGAKHVKLTTTSLGKELQLPASEMGREEK